MYKGTDYVSLKYEEESVLLGHFFVLKFVFKPEHCYERTTSLSCLQDMHYIFIFAR